MHPNYLRLLIVVAPGPGPSWPDRGEPTTDPLTGPRLRRVLGKALIDRYCPHGSPICDGSPGGPRQSPGALCSLAGHCPYGTVYAGSLTGRPPFALYVPASAPDGAECRTEHAAERPIELTLFGPATVLASWLLSALRQALLGGVGHDRLRYRMVRVDRTRDLETQTLCDSDLAALPPIIEPDSLNLRVEPFIAPSRVAVELLSPVRLVQDDRILMADDPIPFHVLVARTLDRFRDLYGRDASDILRKDIREVVLREADQVALVADNTRWVEVPDYSARQRAELRLGGKVGWLEYATGAARFLPILRAAEVLHVGKNAAAGCGRVRTWLAEAAASEGRP